jgi:hypothetical protein
VSEPQLEPHTVVLLRRPGARAGLPWAELARLQGRHPANYAEACTRLTEPGTPPLD